MKKIIYNCVFCHLEKWNEFFFFFFFGKQFMSSLISILIRKTKKKIWISFLVFFLCVCNTIIRNSSSPLKNVFCLHHPDTHDNILQK